MKLSVISQNKINLAAVRICENLYNQNNIYRDMQDWQDKDLQAKDLKLVFLLKQQTLTDFHRG